MNPLLRRSLPWFMVAGVLTLLGFIAVVSFAFNGNGDSKTTHTFSSSFATKADKLEFLATYVTLPTEVEDVAFHIWYQDNSIGMPGPSDWDIQLILKVKPDYIDAWLSDYTAVPLLDIGWASALTDWQPSSDPAFFVDAYGSELTVYQREGIVLKRLSTN